MDKNLYQSSSPLPINWVRVLTLAITQCGLALLCLSIIHHSSSLAALWLPTSVLMTVLFYHRYREWPGLLLAAACGIFAAHTLLGTPFLRYVPYVLNNLLEASIGAALLRRALPGNDPLNGLGNWLKFLVIAVLFTPLLSTLVLVLSNMNRSADELHLQATTWYLSEAVAVLVLTPIGMVYKHGDKARLLASGRLSEFLLTLGVTLFSCFLALKWLPFPFAFITLPLLWVAIRMPRLEAFLIFLATTMMVGLLQASVFMNVYPNMLKIWQGLLFAPLLLVLLPVSAMSLAMHSLRVERSNITESENRFRNAMEYSAIGMALVSPEGKFLQGNKALCTLLGYDPDYLQTLSFQDITHPEDLHSDLYSLQQLLDGVIEDYTLEKRYLCHNGKMVWAQLAVSLVRDDDERPLYFIAQVKDISDLKKTEKSNQVLSEALHEEKELLQITLNAINDAVISTDKAMNITFMNPVAEKMTGWSEQQAQGQPVSHIVHISNGVDGPLISDFTPFDTKENQHTSLDQSLILHGNNTGLFDVQLAVSPLKTLADEPIGIVLVLQNVSKSRELMRQLSYSASHDLLTGLSNRGSFEKSLKSALLLTQIEHQTHCLAFIDLDRFKLVNDSAGHAAGDELLREISQLMLQNLRNSDSLARLGGDEFAILLFNCDIKRGLPILQNIIEKINAYTLFWDNHVYGIGASAGITLMNNGQISPSEYMAQADLACYNAKHNGRGQVFVSEGKKYNSKRGMD